MGVCRSSDLNKNLYFHLKMKSLVIQLKLQKPLFPLNNEKSGNPVKTFFFPCLQLLIKQSGICLAKGLVSNVKDKDLEMSVFCFKEI